MNVPNTPIASSLFWLHGYLLYAWKKTVILTYGNKVLGIPKTEMNDMIVKAILKKNLNFVYHKAVYTETRK